MTPIEKAKYLLKLFRPYAQDKELDALFDYDAMEYNTCMCAINCVNEIKSSKPREPFEYSDTQGYWLEVENILRLKLEQHT